MPTDAALDAQEELHRALGRRRNGRAAAEACLNRLTESWTRQSRDRAVEESAHRPWRLIAVQIPPRSDSVYDVEARDPLTPWHLAVIAVYQTAVDWDRATAALWVPHGIATQLLTPATPMTTIDLLADPTDWAAPAATLLATWNPAPDTA
ncbi:hypothetical protein SRB5_20860 [Streptomyces sp. RB5]|uniref:Uncharacterized protein n=1 Tax=Streptomyces smaragdinus TaxID=2585196 RepID=A0A7K0CER4_9ACTN|nr:hypothetical protein [Streptomyces smaragdinus]MQY11958.1 hypothetical protein [Streptomyces smaragdinus]